MHARYADHMKADTVEADPMVAAGTIQVVSGRKADDEEDVSGCPKSVGRY